ncbi:hypothetical protein ACTXGQ_19620 [Marinobacter sp. 1Y8]
MTSIVELEMWSSPGACLPAEFGKEFKVNIDSALELDDSIFLGLSFVPEKIDSENLSLSFRLGELAVEDFEVFCRFRGFEPNLQNHESAARFLEFEYGRPVAWLHLPYNNRGIRILNKLMSWAVKNGFSIQNPDLCYCLLPASPVPAEW